MSWSPNQVKCAGMATRAAEWTERERQLVLAHLGVKRRPRVGESPRCSANDPANTDEQFVAFMAVAEGVALGKGRGDMLPRPKHKGFWRDAAADRGNRTKRLIEVIAAEAVERMPSKFEAAFLAGFVERMTRNDHFSLSPKAPAHVAECDEGQLYRILEGLKAWVGREFYAAGYTPRSFIIPPNAKRGAA